MELRQLKYFVKTAETLNFSEAARALPLAKRTLMDAVTCMDTVNDLKKMLSGSLNIGITYTFAPILTETVIAFTKAHPAVKLNIFYKTMEELMSMPSSVHPAIESHVLFDNNLSVIVNRYHPLAEKEKITLQDILPHGIAMPAKGLQSRNEFDKLYPSAYNQMKVRMELNEVNVLLDIVRGSSLITILSEAVIHQTNGLVAIPFDVPDNIMVGCVHTERGAYRKKAAEEFIRMLQESEAVRERAIQWLE